MSAPPIVVMGVSGSGKTTVAEALAERLGGEFLDADPLHPASNVTKMASGRPLDDVDRAPWLDTVGRAMHDITQRGGTPVVACSALKRSYRDRILAAEPEAFFVLLDVPIEELDRRLRTRRGHFMPVSLLGSQLATLEPLASDEAGATIAANGSLDDTIEHVVQRLPSAR